MDGRQLVLDTLGEGPERNSTVPFPRRVWRVGIDGLDPASILCHAGKFPERQINSRMAPPRRYPLSGTYFEAPGSVGVQVTAS